MERKTEHYYSPFPDAKLKVFSVSESFRKHLYVFKTATGMFSSKKIDLGTKILINYITIPKDPSVLLDLGCGYGPIGIVLAYQSPNSTVYMTDINRRAIWCAKENIKLNIQKDRKRVIAVAGSYFEPFEHKSVKFDGIYINPPWREGRKEFMKICEEIPSYIKPNGVFQFVVKRKMGAEFMFEYLKKQFPSETVEILCKKSGYWVFSVKFTEK